MRLQQLLREAAEGAPAVAVPAGLFDRARRRHRRRWSAAMAAVVVALFGGYALSPFPTGAQVGGSQAAGLPERLVVPPWWTETLTRSPNGPVAVAFNGNSPQADYEDGKIAFWRDGYSFEPSVVVGLERDTYRIVRSSNTAGVALSPDGRYLLGATDPSFGDRAQVLDLTTGVVRQLSGVSASAATEWSTDGRWVVAREADRESTWVGVFSWPAGQIEWQLRYPASTSGASGADSRRLALSPDGSMLAVLDHGDVRVFRRDAALPEQDGSLLWQREVGLDLLAGRAAWVGDGRLAVLRRSEPVCPACPEQESAYPGAWWLTFLDGATGAEVTAPAYPRLDPAMGVRVVAWRGATAYAVVQWTAGLAHPEPNRVALVRLEPGATEAYPVLIGPPGTYDLNVATDYVDQIRPAGTPENGVDTPEVVARTLIATICLAPFVVPLGLLVWMWRRRRTQARWQARLGSDRAGSPGGPAPSR